MSKTSFINTRIEPDLKMRVEFILKKLGLSATDAITIFYNQIDLKKGLPFEVRLPNKTSNESKRKISNAINSLKMATKQISILPDKQSIRDMINEGRK